MVTAKSVRNAINVTIADSGRKETATQNVRLSGVDDMVLLPRISEEAIVDNLRKRYMDDYIFTCIGPVLVSVNPFKQMPYFGDREIEQYQGAAPYENPPHIYGLSDELYRNMMIDRENQCVIISGESGAGKTVAAKYIMSYITKVSGGGAKVQHVKDVVLKSNPLLEAFGNAKTVRNNNSSRFGKYVELLFDSSGEPTGGKISNFLLEKSRVVMHNVGERNFHIFYQLCCGANDSLKQELGILDLDYYQYLSHGGNHSVQGINDGKDFGETIQAMSVMGLNGDNEKSILKVTAAILHLGNINFCENGNYAAIENNQSFPAYLLCVQESELNSKLISRKFDSKWGSQSDTIDVTLNVEQATYTRDALAKAIYARLFDYLVNAVNEAMTTRAASGQNVGILDIYGFEIFEKNGFEQFCINFVNEKLQQIFIEFTLKSEQEEYAAEKIEWTPVEFFNNKVVCDLIEGKRPPGIFSVLDDVCATLHAMSAGADSDLLKKLNGAARNHGYYEEATDAFVVRHYAGRVAYTVEGFCDRNRDVLFPDLVELMQSSTSPFIRKLFAGDGNSEPRSRPTTAGSKIRSQANALMETLSHCRPHYVRCIKPNETKRPRDWNEERVRHQVEYLGLKENIRVRRAGFVYRRPFGKFTFRYGILMRDSKDKWQGDDKADVERIMRKLNIPTGQYQLGLTKVFIKAPETLFMLERERERKYNYYARVIQRAFKKHFAFRQSDKNKMAAAALLRGKKERRPNSINRNFAGDYVGLDSSPALSNLLGRREKVSFAQTVKKYDRNFKSSCRHLIVTDSNVYLVGRKKITKGKNRGTYSEVVKRKLALEAISGLTMSPLRDDFVVIHARDSYDTLLEITFKTEFLYCLTKNYYLKLGRNLNLNFSDKIEYAVKNEGLGGGSTRRVIFSPDEISTNGWETLKGSGRTLVVTVPKGLPVNSVPSCRKSSSQTIGKKKGKIITGELNGKIANNNNTIKNNNVVSSGGGYRRAAPPPPSEPAPPNQPVISSFRLNYHQRSNQVGNKENEGIGDRREATGNHPLSAGRNPGNPVPGGGRPKPPIKPKPKSLPKCKAVYDYTAQDSDELSFVPGDIINIIKEHEGGWWQGCLKGKEGLFPSNYVEKI